MNLKNIAPFEATPNERTRSKKGNGVVTVVCSPKNGKRLELLPSLVTELQIEDTVQLGLLDGCMVIAKNLPNIEQSFSVKSRGKKKIIYSSALVAEIIRKLKLDFTARVSLTLHGVQCDEYNGIKVAKVWEDEV